MTRRRWPAVASHRAVVLDLNGTPIPLDYDFTSLADITTAMDRRQHFVAAGSQKLAEEIVAVLQPFS